MARIGLRDLGSCMGYGAKRECPLWGTGKYFLIPQAQPAKATHFRVNILANIREDGGTLPLIKNGQKFRFPHLLSLEPTQT
jgi:hypothetical protein